MKAHTFDLVANAGSAFAYSIAMTLLDCFVDTGGPFKCTCKLDSLDKDQEVPYLNVGLKLIGEFLESLHFCGRKGVHVEKKGVAGRIEGV